MSNPLAYQWTGECWKPLPRFHNQAGALFGAGEVRTLVDFDEDEARTAKSHAHYFAAVGEVWKNLPEDIGDRYATPAHLRKAALIKAGYRDERTIACFSKAEALRVAAFVKPMDTYAIVTVREAVVTVYTAHSQGMKAMGSKTFQASKQAVLDVLSELLGVEVGQIKQAVAA